MCQAIGPGFISTELRVSVVELGHALTQAQQQEKRIYQLATTQMGFTEAEWSSIKFGESEPTGTRGVPCVDCLGSPTSDTSDHCVGIGQPVAAQCAGAYADPIGYLRAAQVPHCHLCTIRRTSEPSSPDFVSGQQFRTGGPLRTRECPGCVPRCCGYLKVDVEAAQPRRRG